MCKASATTKDFQVNTKITFDKNTTSPPNSRNISILYTNGTCSSERIKIVHLSFMVMFNCCNINMYIEMMTETANFCHHKNKLVGLFR